MGVLKALDKLANAGARSRMPEAMHTYAKAQSGTTNHRNQLAIVANGFGVGKPAQRAAKEQLIEEVGPAEAERLMKQAVHKVRKSFTPGR
jgi:hypothetical protein